MTNKKYDKIVNKVIETINDEVILMTEQEEFDYKKRVINSLKVWLGAFPFMHLIPEK